MVYIKSWKELDQLEDIDQIYFCSNYYVCVSKYGVECEHHQDSGKIYGWINSIDTYGWFQSHFRYWLGRRSLDDERKINK